MRKQIQKIGALVLLTLISLTAWADGYPLGPDSRLTTGQLCEHGDSQRYDEKIEYCNRSVSVSTKWDIIDEYEKLGYEIRSLGRENFKIDHLIPLCAGGSNDVSNLWPQYRDIYEKTDKIEEMSCRLMSQGKLLQADAIAKILDAKLNLDKAPEIEREMSELLGEPSPNDSMLLHVLPANPLI